MSRQSLVTATRSSRAGCCHRLSIRGPFIQDRGERELTNDDDLMLLIGKSRGLIKNREAKCCLLEAASSTREGEIFLEFTIPCSRFFATDNSGSSCARLLLSHAPVAIWSRRMHQSISRAFCRS